MLSGLASIAQLGLLLAVGVLVAGPRRARSCLVWLAQAHLCGAAALGGAVTLSLLGAQQFSPLRAVFFFVILAAGTGLLRWRFFPPVISSPATEASPEIRKPTPPRGWLELALLGLLVVGLLVVAARLALLPLDWDGWAIWQFKARAMVDGGLRELLTLPDYRYSHQDYPLLVPAQTWWLCAGTFRPKLGQVSDFLFFLDLLVLVYAFTEARAGRIAALVGCVVVLSWPVAVKHSMSGFADIPMAAYALATMGFLAEGELWLSAVCLTGALLTKQEGLFTLGAALAAGWLSAPETFAASGPAGRWQRMAGIAAVGALAGGGWWLVKRQWGLVGDMLNPSNWPKDPLWEALRRTPVIARGVLDQALSFGPHYPGWGLFWPVAAGGLFLSVRHRLRVTLPFWLLGAAHFAGAAAAYAITPNDPWLHLTRSIDRLWLHVAPAILVATLIAIHAIWPKSGESP